MNSTRYPVSLAVIAALVLTSVAMISGGAALAAGTDAWKKVGTGGISEDYNVLQGLTTSMCVFKSKLYAGTNSWDGGGEVWRYDGGSWALVNTPGFGDEHVQGISSMAVLGDYLYAGTEGGSGACSVWRTDGSGGTPYHWTSVSSSSDVGKTGNTSVSSMALSLGSLYAGTRNQSGCQVWAYNGATWSQCVGQGANLTPTGPGFGNTLNREAASMAVAASGIVSVGTQNNSGGDVWSGINVSWSRTNLQGFSDSKNYSVGAMSFFNSKLYAVTDNYTTGCEVWRYDGPAPNNWSQVNSNGFGNVNDDYGRASVVFGSPACLYVAVENGDGGCKVMRYNGTGWGQANQTGFGDQETQGLSSMAVFSGKLYAGASGVQGSLIYGTAGGSTVPHGWTLASIPGFTTNDNETITSSAFFRGDLYVGTYSGRGCEVWRYGAFGWSRVAVGGFGDKYNESVMSMAATDSYLYVGTGNWKAGCEVLRYDGKSWAQVNKNGFGDSKADIASAMIVHGGKLYVGIQNYSNLAVVWRFDGPGTSNWTKVSKSGFGDSFTISVSSMVIFKGKLHVGTYGWNKPGRVWRYDGPAPSNWTPVSEEGFGVAANYETSSMAVYGGSLYAGTYNNMHTGCEIYRYSGAGTTWSMVAEKGFGDANNITAQEMAVFRNRLYVGTIGGDTGGELWNYDGGTWRQANSDGFGTADNEEIDALSTDGRQLFAGTDNGHTGGEVWMTEAPASTWYLAEGTTAWGFDTYISITNPNTTAVHASITYMTGTGNVSGGTITLPARSQTTVNPADKLGNKDFSTKVVCTEGKTIAVDRTMSWTGPGAASPEGHSSVGVTSPAKTWYLPEGSSAWGFETWLLIQNPNAGAATASVTYMIEGEAPKTVSHSVPANSRQSFNMETDIGQKNASIKVDSNVPVIPERAMYRNNKREGHDSIGTTTSALDYFMAEGTTAWGFTTWVLIQNPASSASEVTITYMTPSGKKAQAPFSLPGNSRKTIKVNDVAGMAGTDFSTQVHGTKPIIAERAMYWDNGTGEACHDSIGMNKAHTTFYLPDGETSNAHETWTLVQNPNASAVNVEVSYLKAGGGAVSLTKSIPANSRQTFNMADKVPSGRASIMVTSKTSGKKIMVERAMYWNSRGAGTDTIGGYSD